MLNEEGVKWEGSKIDWEYNIHKILYEITRQEETWIQNCIIYHQLVGKDPKSFIKVMKPTIENAIQNLELEYNGVVIGKFIVQVLQNGNISIDSEVIKNARF